MPEFPVGEYAARGKRLEKKLAEAGLDLLFVSGEENNRYFSAARSLVTWRSFTRPVFSLMHGAAAPVVLTHESLKDATLSEGYYSDVRSYTDITKSPVGQLKSMLQTMLPRGGRIGYEGVFEQRIGFPFADMERLKSVTSPEIEFVDASGLLWDLRENKSEIEVKCMKEAGRALGRARPRAISRMRPGMTEREAARLVAQAVLEEGADDVAFVHVNAGAPHTWYPTDRRLKRGDTVYVDAGATVKGYTCEYDRIATVGQASATQRDLHSSVLTIASGMKRMMKAGVTCAQVATEANRVASSLGYPGAKWGRVGHGQGLLATEPPSVAVHDKTVLRPGMTVSNEPGIITKEGVFVWEDVFNITSGGPLKLSVEGTELVTIS